MYMCVCACVCAVCSVAQSCLTLCDPMVCSLPRSSVHGIFLARIVEWVAMPSSRGSSQAKDRTRASCITSIGRQVLYHTATWEAHIHIYNGILVSYKKECIQVSPNEVDEPMACYIE